MERTANIRKVRGSSPRGTILAGPRKARPAAEHARPPARPPARPRRRPRPAAPPAQPPQPLRRSPRAPQGERQDERSRLPPLAPRWQELGAACGTGRVPPRALLLCLPNAASTRAIPRGRKDTHRGARTHDHKVRSLLLTFCCRKQLQSGGAIAFPESSWHSPGSTAMCLLGSAGRACAPSACGRGFDPHRGLNAVVDRGEGAQVFWRRTMEGAPGFQPGTRGSALSRSNHRAMYPAATCSHTWPRGFAHLSTSSWHLSIHLARIELVNFSE